MIEYYKVISFGVIYMGEDWPVWLNWVVLVVGVLYLVGDLGFWTVWSQNIEWYTVAFVLAGLAKVSPK